jgi:hypothetical protein
MGMQWKERQEGKKQETPEKERTTAGLFVVVVQEAPDGLARDADIPSDAQHFDVPPFDVIVDGFRAEAEEPCQLLDVDKPHLAEQGIQVVIGDQGDVIE